MTSWPWLLCDLDGTLCNEDARVHLGKAGDWQQYFASINGDCAHNDVLRTLHIMSGPVRILIVTSRPEAYRGMTEQWLRDKEVPFDSLLMRPNNDDAESHISKIALIEEFFGSKECVLSSVLFALEDRDKVVQAFREYGIPCWQVRNGQY